MNASRHTNRNSEVFIFLLLLTGFFLLLEISFFIQCNRTYFSDYTFMSDHIRLPPTIWPGIFYFLLAQLSVHLIYCIFIWEISRSVARLLKLSSNQEIKLSIGVWLSGIIFILAANQFFFPNSKFVELSAILLSGKAIKLIVVFFSCMMIFFISLATVKSSMMKISLVMITLFSYEYLHPFARHTADAGSTQKPNIIIIGVDSLRPDYLSYFGHTTATPFFDSFLEQATVFSEALTPLARTFPSWTSILTGQYPRQIDIRTNLSQQNRADFSHTLPSLLHKQGYTTIYATDETRFSNIDVNFGFDKIITPPMGLNDFLLGTFNDFPLSNLLINTPVGKWLFPFSYANRPAYFSYEPDSFLHLIRPHIAKNRSKPLFLAIHFCLPHYPYLWASLSGREHEPLERYDMSITRVDQQLHDFFELLKQASLLDHTIIVLLSDHGEALELPGDRITDPELFIRNKKIPTPQFYLSNIENNTINQSVGHGTDVLSLTQYHTLLAFRLYGAGQQRHGIIPGIVSLLSIKPTVLDLVHDESNDHSLMPLIRGDAQVLSQREHIFLESDFTPEAILTVYPKTRQIILEGIQLFQVDPLTTRLSVRDDMYQMIIHSKQYADVYGEWMLALYPQNNHYRMPILVNLINGQWTNDLHSPFAQHSPAAEMLLALHTFYGSELH